MTVSSQHRAAHEAAISTLTVRLALPPSVNSIWRATIGRNGKPRTYRARTYAAWMHTAAWTVKEAVTRKGPIIGDVSVEVYLHPRRGDLDNRLKAICDALVQGGAITDDDAITRLYATWDSGGDVHKGAVVMVKPA